MNFAKWISFSTVIILIYIIWQIRRIVLLALTAVILALILDLLVKKLQSIGLKRTQGVFLSIVTLIIIILSFIFLFFPPLFFQFQELVNLVPQGVDKLVLQIDKIKGDLSPEISNLIPNLEQLLPQIQPLIQDLLTRGWNFVSGFLGALLSSLLLLVLTLMLLVDPVSYQEGFIRFFPHFYRDRVTAILKLVKIKLEELFIDTFLKIFSITILTFICLFVFKIPLVLVQSLLAGILAFTPYFGAFVSVISPMAIAFIDSPVKPWLILISYIIINQVVERIIIPKLRPDRVQLVAGNIIIGQVIFANFLGLLGLFLALPLTLICQVLIKEILVKDIFDRWQKKFNSE